MSIKWKIDKAHSVIQFKARHLMITTVTGYFRDFDLEVETEDEAFNSVTKILFTAETGSIDTNDEKRDGHLKSAEFFDVEQYPQLKFEGDKFEKDGNKAKLTGRLTIRDVTKTIQLDVEFAGTAVDHSGNKKAGFTVTGKINRKQFGLMWDSITDAGQIVLGDEIRIQADVQLNKEKGS